MAYKSKPTVNSTSPATNEQKTKSLVEDFWQRARKAGIDVQEEECEIADDKTQRRKELETEEQWKDDEWEMVEDDIWHEE